MADRVIPRPKLMRFARLMESRLLDNEGKGGWRDCDPEWLLDRLYQEAKELSRETGPEGKHDSKRIGQEAADVANFAMMIADVCEGLPR